LEEQARVAAQHPPARFDQGTEGARVDEAREAARSIEELERVARRRGVEHEGVVAGLGVELVELLHRHVLLRARDRVRDLRVDAVAEQPVARGGVGGVALDELVEGALGVEHHRPQLPAHLDAGPGEALGLDATGLVVELLEAERLSEPAGGVDGENGHALPAGGEPHGESPPPWSSYRRRPSPRRSPPAFPR
jgi:hypothetical protein